MDAAFLFFLSFFFIFVKLERFSLWRELRQGFDLTFLNLSGSQTESQLKRVYVHPKKCQSSFHGTNAHESSHLWLMPELTLSRTALGYTKLDFSSQSSLDYPLLTGLHSAAKQLQSQR